MKTPRVTLSLGWGLGRRVLFMRDADVLTTVVGDDTYWESIVSKY